MTAPTKPLGVAEVRELLVRAVEEKGADYIYVNPDGESAIDGTASCVNWDHDGNPSCIAGHVFVWAGVEPNPDLDGEVVGVVNRETEILTDEAAAALNAAQYTQDGGGTWGDALAEFDRVAMS